MGAGAGDCPGGIVARRAHVGVASDAQCDRRRPSFGRMFGLRLASEAAGQVGVFGQVFGDTWRVAGLGADLPIATRITSVALDRALYTLSSTIVTIAGIVRAGLPVTAARQDGSLRKGIWFRPRALLCPWR